MSKAQEEKRMFDSLKIIAKKKREEQIDRDTHDHDLTYENEQSMVTIPLREYDKLKQQGQYITDPSLISIIDKIEELTRALRRHIVRKF
jgi:hypothetical protein|tara:strand:- start:104 stop:370 length:267 start_codon:yes stop_codon:yes gene_type:complete